MRMRPLLQPVTAPKKTDADIGQGAVGLRQDAGGVDKMWRRLLRSTARAEEMSNRADARYLRRKRAAAPLKRQDAFTVSRAASVRLGARSPRAARAASPSPSTSRPSPGAGPPCPHHQLRGRRTRRGSTSFLPSLSSRDDLLRRRRLCEPPTPSHRRPGSSYHVNAAQFAGPHPAVVDKPPRSLARSRVPGRPRRWTQAIERRRAGRWSGEACHRSPLRAPTFHRLHLPGRPHSRPGRDAGRTAPKAGAYRTSRCCSPSAPRSPSPAIGSPVTHGCFGEPASTKARLRRSPASPRRAQRQLASRSVPRGPSRDSRKPRSSSLLASNAPRTATSPGGGRDADACPATGTLRVRGRCHHRRRGPRPPPSGHFRFHRAPPSPPSNAADGDAAAAAVAAAAPPTDPASATAVSTAAAPCSRASPSTAISIARRRRPRTPPFPAARRALRKGARPPPPLALASVSDAARRVTSAAAHVQRQGPRGVRRARAGFALGVRRNDDGARRRGGPGDAEDRLRAPRRRPRTCDSACFRPRQDACTGRPSRPSSRGALSPTAAQMGLVMPSPQGPLRRRQPRASSAALAALLRPQHGPASRSRRSLSRGRRHLQPGLRPLHPGRRSSGSGQRCRSANSPFVVGRPQGAGGRPRALSLRRRTRPRPAEATFLPVGSVASAFKPRRDARDRLLKGRDPAAQIAFGRREARGRTFEVEIPPNARVIRRPAPPPRRQQGRAWRGRAPRSASTETSLFRDPHDCTRFGWGPSAASAAPSACLIDRRLAHVTSALVPSTFTPGPVPSPVGADATVYALLARRGADPPRTAVRSTGEACRFSRPAGRASKRRPPVRLRASYDAEGSAAPSRRSPIDKYAAIAPDMRPEKHHLPDELISPPPRRPTSATSRAVQRASSPRGPLSTRARRVRAGEAVSSFKRVRDASSSATSICAFVPPGSRERQGSPLRCRRDRPLFRPLRQAASRSPIEGAPEERARAAAAPESAAT